jgi:hypothetical protein
MKTLRLKTSAPIAALTAMTNFTYTASTGEKPDRFQLNY